VNTLFETGQDGGTATTHDWLTPPEILNALGIFDLDPCSSEHQPWATACHHLTIRDDGLSKPWVGRVWCNPPYGPFASKWLERCADHGNAIAFVFARTETAMFQDHVWPKADGLLFLRGRVQFRLPGGGAQRSCRGTERPDCLRAEQRRRSRVVWHCRGVCAPSGR